MCAQKKIMKYANSVPTNNQQNHKKRIQIIIHMKKLVEYV